MTLFLKEVYVAQFWRYEDMLPFALLCWGPHGDDITVVLTHEQARDRKSERSGGARLTFLIAIFSQE